MTPERWQQVKQIVQSAIARPPSERDGFISQACANDPDLRSQVQSLISSYDEPDDLFQTVAVNLAAQTVYGDDATSLVGHCIGPYQVTARIGQGGMGEVYLAQDSRLGRKVALKLLIAQFTALGERVRRFEQEARSASSLNHPNIITVHDVGQTEGRHYLVTEYVEGETLRQRMESAPQQMIDVSEALDVAMQVATALAAAHEAGIVHRDIKPENIMLRPDGLVKVLDFGLAKLTEANTPAFGPEASTVQLVNTESGLVMGTPRYMSPEQARGQRVDGRTDIFSLAVVLYEMIAGRAPFAGDSAAEVIAAILDREPVALSHKLPAVPGELERIISKALRKEREDRYQAIKDLLVDLKDLKRALEPSPISHRQYRIAGVTVLVILLIAALGVWRFVRRAQAETERKAAVAEVEHLVDLGRFVDVWRVTRAALQRWPATLSSTRRCARQAISSPSLPIRRAPRLHSRHMTISAVSGFRSARRR